MSDQLKPTADGEYACKVCGNTLDEHGTLEHGKGCYTQSEDGGGSEYIEEADKTKATNEPTQPADATNWKQRAEEAERQRDELAEMLKVKNRAANIAELTKRAESAEAEIERLNQLNKALHDDDIYAVTQQLTAANERLAKVRDAITRLAKWAELSPFAESILAEAQAALAEGER